MKRLTMKIQYEKLKEFRDLKIDINELSKFGAIDLFNAEIDSGTPEKIEPAHVINLLREFKDGNISKEKLLDWVNTIWFTELFDYDDAYSNSIASVLDKLEDLDEGSRKLSHDEIDKYIDALLKNKEV